MLRGPLTLEITHAGPHSDLLIAVNVADAAELPGPPVWVILTYLAAQTLLAVGWLRSRDEI